MKRSTFSAMMIGGAAVVAIDAGIYLSWRGLFPHSSCGLAMPKKDFQDLASAVRMYAINAGRPPTTSQGLEALVSAPTRGPVPAIYRPLMKEVPLDPWGRRYDYICHGRSADGRDWDFEIRCAGADGHWGTDDDLSSRD